MTSVERRDDRRQSARAVGRLVLTGASNLTAGIGTVIDAAAGIWGGPLEVLAAWGHGRSYGLPSRLLGRELPGIRQCGLWDDLARKHDLPAAALVTDIGNDLLYEQPVERVAGWVEECFDQLVAARAETVVTLLPLEHLAELGRARFYFFRTLFVPRCRIGMEEMMLRARELDRAVERLARQRGFTTKRPRREWYGIDPIHIRLSQRRRAWFEITSEWKDGEPKLPASAGGLARTFYLRTRTPERRRMFGFLQRGRKPAAVLGNGTTVSIY